jgi:hypothetical protein
MPNAAKARAKPSETVQTYPGRAMCQVQRADVAHVLRHADNPSRIKRCDVRGSTWGCRDAIMSKNMAK